MYQWTHEELTLNRHKVMNGHHIVPHQSMLEVVLQMSHCEFYCLVHGWGKTPQSSHFT